MPDQALRRRNLDFFKTSFPKIGAVLEDHRPAYRLDELPDGDFRLAKTGPDGQEIFTQAGVGRTELNAGLQRFMAAPTRLRTSPVTPDRLDRFSGLMLDRLLRKAVADDIAFTQDIQGRRAGFLTVLGVGLGLHLDALLEMSDAVACVLVEPDGEMLHHSLGIFDWRAFFERQTRRRLMVSFLISSEPDRLADGIRIAIRGTNPAMLDGSLLYRTYSHPVLDSVAKDGGKVIQQAVMGLGFFDDEVFMIRNSRANLSHGDTRICTIDKQARQDWPLFVIGSGPSLDRDLDAIAALQDRAVVMSCGTALRPLLARGIVPDLHVELERNEALVPVIEEMMPVYGEIIANLPLITSSTTDPRVPGYFRETLYYFRPALSCTPIFAQDERWVLAGSGPSVVNGGLAAGQALGFREVYFFGVDLGSRVQAQAHSRDAWYNSEAGQEVGQPFDRTEQANFGGMAHTNMEMLWYRAEIELSIRDYGMGRAYANCSDGIAIAGARALESGALVLPHQLQPKADAIRALLDGQDIMSAQAFAVIWDEAEMAARLQGLAADLRRVVDNADLFDKRYLARAMRVMVPKDKALLGWAMLFRGSLFMGLVACEFYLNRVQGEQARNGFAEQCRRGLLWMIDEMEAEARHLLLGLDSQLAFLRDRSRPIPAASEPHWRDYFADYLEARQGQVGFDD